MYSTSLKTWALAVAIDSILIGVARRLYRERLGIKTDEDIQNEFAQHRALVRQVNNVDDTSTK